MRTWLLPTALAGLALMTRTPPAAADGRVSIWDAAKLIKAAR